MRQVVFKFLVLFMCVVVFLQVFSIFSFFFFYFFRWFSTKTNQEHLLIRHWYLFGNPFLDITEASLSATLLKKRHWHGLFPVNFAKFLRIPLVAVSDISINGKTFFILYCDLCENICQIWNFRNCLFRYFSLLSIIPSISCQSSCTKIWSRSFKSYTFFISYKITDVLF